MLNIDISERKLSIILTIVITLGVSYGISEIFAIFTLEDVFSTAFWAIDGTLWIALGFFGYYGLFSSKAKWIRYFSYANAAIFALMLILFCALFVFTVSYTLIFIYFCILRISASVGAFFYARTIEGYP